MQKCDRERAGLGCSLLVEAERVRHAIAKIGIGRRDAIMAKLDKDLQKVVPDPQTRATLVTHVCRFIPEIHDLNRACISTEDYGFDPRNHSDEIFYAKQVKRMVEVAIEECHLAAPR